MAQITKNWEEIIAIANAGTGQDNFAVGDSKELTLTDSTNPVNAQIVGFNHDNLSDGTGKANITFSFEYLYEDEKRMDDYITNTGSWSATEMRNTTMPLIYDVLPPAIKNNVRQVVKHTGRYDSSTTVAQQTTQDKLWLFSCNEVGLEDYRNNTDETSDNNKIYSYYSPAGEGSAENAKRIKRTAEGENGASWWLRTPNSFGDSCFCFVHSSGYGYHCDAPFPDGVACGFCIGTDTPPSSFTYDLSTLTPPLQNGDKIKVVCKADGYTDSEPSNEITMDLGYTVSYQTNGGTAVASQEGLTNLPDPLPTTTRTDHTFGGWYTNSGLTTLAVAGATISADTTLYAKWTLSGYPITYNLTNCTVLEPPSVIIDDLAIAIIPDEEYGYPSSVTVSGAIADYEPNMGVLTLTDPTGPVTITASAQKKSKLHAFRINIY